MKANDPCSVCGSRDLNLIDGYYYCVECGTQDTNVRETQVDEACRILADGQLAFTSKRKIIHIKDAQVQMSGEWYKWHVFNFILSGLADELIALGAAPTFKTKLLWIWTKYVKKYQIKGKGHTVNNETNGASILQQTLNTTDNEDCDAGNEDTSKEKIKLLSRRRTADISIISSGLLCSILYVALNLDKSDIQISHLFRFVDEGKLDITNFNRHLPKDVNLKAVSGWSNFCKSCGDSSRLTIFLSRIKAMSLFKTLDLGFPVLPDMRKIVNNFITELCLPDEFKDVVFSLMHLWPCDYLEVDQRNLNKIVTVPDYEGVAMSYIIVALKMVFGLDDQYEYKLADVVDKINEKNMYSKCYKLGFTPEPTGRIFSFREWINYLQCRRKMLYKFRLCGIEMAHYLDIDDYAYFENLSERRKGKVLLTDELTMNILNKIPLNDDIVTILNSELPHTLTPMTTYTDIITNHCKDSETMQLLIEDFKQYSLKYACESLDLTDFEELKNILTGVSDNNKIETGKDLLCSYTKSIKMKRKLNMIFIRNCENKNWKETQKPSTDHVSFEYNEKNNENDSKSDSESDKGYNSNSENIPSDKETSIEICDNMQLETITEEDKDINIFDDLFINLEISDDTETQDDINFDEIEEHRRTSTEQNEFDNDMDDNKSISSVDSFEYNPETFNRERAIKELIIQACRKYKIQIPKEYRSTELRKRKGDLLDEGQPPKKHIKTSDRLESKQRIKKLLEAYFNYVENDVINKMAKEVKAAIWESDQSKHLEGSVDQVNEQFHNSQPVANSIIDDHDKSKEINSSIVLPDTNNISKIECQDNLEPILFEGESDEGEVDDLIPKSDTRFDDKEYDTSQLYLKIQDNSMIEPVDIYASIQDPEIDKILERAIDEYNKKPNNFNNKESSDSEDDVPLKIIQEERDLCLKGSEKENLEPLIKSESIQEFKYWVKRYHDYYIGREFNVGIKFDSEIYENTPKTFSFLLKECASISGCRQFCLYKNMQYLEYHILCRAGKKVTKQYKPRT